MESACCIAATNARPTLYALCYPPPPNRQDDSFGGGGLRATVEQIKQGKFNHFGKGRELPSRSS